MNYEWSQSCCREDRGSAHCQNKKESLHHCHGQRREDQDEGHHEVVNYRGVDGTQGSFNKPTHRLTIRIT